MVWLWDLLFVFVIACIVFGAVYTMAVRPTYSTQYQETEDSAADIGCLWLVLLFFLFFLPIWGGGLWLEPIGPAIGGSYIANFLVIAFIAVMFFLVVWAVMPGTEFSWHSEAGDSAAGEDGGWGAMFWIFILLLALAIILGYWLSSPHTMDQKNKQASTSTTRILSASPVPIARSQVNSRLT